MKKKMGIAIAASIITLTSFTGGTQLQLLVQAKRRMELTKFLP